ncbi:MAG TPA: EAL domain-containing protein [Mycobacteriales bacterium]|nr:EAL domain-containing protein [Mycobacteriales bacterium]
MVVGLSPADVGVLDLVADALSVGLLVTTADGTAVWSNDALRALLGADPTGLLIAIDPPARPGDRRELAWSGPAGEPRWLDLDCRAMPSAEHGELLLLQVTDGTERHELAERARDRDRRLGRLEALARTGSWEWQVATNEVDWSDELLRMLGYPPGSELNYAAYRSHVHPEDVGTFEQTLARALRTGEPFSYTHRTFPADAATDERVLECHGEVVADDGGSPSRLLVTVRDVTEHRKAADALAFLADHDPLTGLLNRHAVTARLREQLAHASRGGALLLIDLDNFSDLNDLRGHAAGDQVMRAMADLLRHRAGADAVLGRLSGDEFAVILPAGDAADALALAESLCAAVARFPFLPGAASSGSTSKNEQRMTASIGVAPLAPAGDCDVLLANADLALSEAKAAGRNGVRVFEPEQYQLAVRRVSVLQRARNALENGLMVVYAQPIFDLATRKVTSHELLVRLRDGLDPMIGPGEFLPAMERTDLVNRLDRWMLQQGVTALATPRARRENLKLQVNVSARSMEDPGFGDFVVATLSAAGVEPARLGLEITETAAITNLAAARRLANRLTRAGCKFALDDFGAGFGSFTYLKHLPFTSVKIDGEFVRQADRALGDAVFVEAVVTVARGLNMLTIAEYVDREALVQTLTRLGVDRAQGFHLGKPRPLAELLVDE